MKLYIAADHENYKIIGVDKTRKGICKKCKEYFENNNNIELLNKKYNNLIVYNFIQDLDNETLEPYSDNEFLFAVFGAGYAHLATYDIDYIDVEDINDLPPSNKK